MRFWQMIYLFSQTFAPLLAAYGAGVRALGYYHHRYYKQNAWLGEHMNTAERITDAGETARAIQEFTERAQNPEGFTRQEVQRASLIAILAGGVVAFAIALVGLLAHLP